MFKKLPSTDASIILASEPLWATAVAVMLLHTQVGACDVAGGVLILLALGCNQGLLDPALPARYRLPTAERSTGGEDA